MLGLADRGATRALLAALLAGDGKTALVILEEQYALGTGPDSLFESLLELVHAVTRAQATGGVDAALTERGARCRRRLVAGARPCRRCIGSGNCC